MLFNVVLWTSIPFLLFLLVNEGRFNVFSIFSYDLDSMILAILVFLIFEALGIYFLFMAIRHKPLSVDNKGIHFPGLYIGIKYVPLRNIRTLQWVSGIKSNDPRQFLYVITKVETYTIGKRGSRRVRRAVSDIEKLGDTLSLLTGKKIG